MNVEAEFSVLTDPFPVTCMTHVLYDVTLVCRQGAPFIAVCRGLESEAVQVQAGLFVGLS